MRRPPGWKRHARWKAGSRATSGQATVGIMVGVHQRKSPRRTTFDYTSPGAYFITACTHERRCAFGRVAEEGVLLSEAGQIVEEEWLRTAERRPYVLLDSHVTMPNHFHGLIIIQEHTQATRTPSCGPIRHSLSSIVGGFKAAASRRIALLTDKPEPALWQRGYYERVVRNERELRSIRDYIANNPGRWRQG